MDGPRAPVEIRYRSESFSSTESDGAAARPRADSVDSCATDTSQKLSQPKINAEMTLAGVCTHILNVGESVSACRRFEEGCPQQEPIKNLLDELDSSQNKFRAAQTAEFLAGAGGLTALLLLVSNPAGWMIGAIAGGTFLAMALTQRFGSSRRNNLIRQTQVWAQSKTGKAHLDLEVAKKNLKDKYGLILLNSAKNYDLRKDQATMNLEAGEYKNPEGDKTGATYLALLKAAIDDDRSSEGATTNLQYATGDAIIFKMTANWLKNEFEENDSRDKIVKRLEDEYVERNKANNGGIGSEDGEWSDDD